MRDNLPDPTYDKKEIEANPVWHVAWILSQCKDDNAPIGWSKWNWVAQEIIVAQAKVKKRK